MSYFSDAVLSLSPIAYWRLGELSGTTASNSSGSGISGVYTGAYTLGNNSLVLNDADNKSMSVAGAGYVSIGAQSSLNLTEFSIAAFVKPAALGSVRQIYSNYIASNSAPNNGVAFELRSDGKLALFSSTIWSSETVNRSVSSAALSANSTYFVVATFIGGVVKLYINGGLDSAHSGKQVPVYTNAVVNIGGLSNAGSFNGAIDDVAVFNYPLRASEIASMYAAGTASLYSISGNSKDIDNNPNSLVSIRNNTTQEKIKIVTPASNGDWSAILPAGDYDFSHFSSTYSPEISGPHTVSSGGVSPAIPDIVLGSSSGVAKTVGYAF